jgi:hypothetical protein
MSTKRARVKVKYVKRKTQKRRPCVPAVILAFNP